jgi:hypothetical protein
MGGKLEATPGTKYNMVTILEETEPKRYDNGTLSRMVKVKCDCGNIRDKNLALVLRGEVKSCGCLSGKGDLNMDAVGTKYNMLTITGEAPRRRSKGGHSKRFVKVKCDCGSEEFEVQLRAIVGENTKSCGCSKKNDSPYKVKTNYNGERFSYLTVIRELDGIRTPKGVMKRIMECQCDCGVIKPFNLNDLKEQKSKSCGCYGRKVKSELTSMVITIGQTRGDLTLIKELEKRIEKDEDGKFVKSIRYVEVGCKRCGNVKKMTLIRFTSDEYPSDCGCGGSQRISESLMDEIKIGEKFNRLTIIKETKRWGSHTDKKTGRTYVRRRVECVCECGVVKDYNYNSVKQGKSKSCGCLAREITSQYFRTHGLTTTPENKRMYHKWMGMLGRCYDANHHSYKDYGGRGISVCERWRLDCKNFIEDMGHPPTPNHSLDRIDVDGNYEYGNCRWADSKTQSMNKRNNKWYKKGEKNPTI